MNIESLRYELRAELKFTRTEINYMIKRCKEHYDGVCQAAGFSIQEGGFQNGFIAQLKMFPTTKTYTVAVWTFNQIDITLKVLEYKDFGEDNPLRLKLRGQLDKTFTMMMSRHKELREQEQKINRSIT